MGFLWHKKRTQNDVEAVKDYLEKRLLLQTRDAEDFGKIPNNPDRQIQYSDREIASDRDGNAGYGRSDPFDRGVLHSWLGENQTKTFVEEISERIRKSGLKDSKIYKRANLDRRLFSRMMSDRNYKPSRDTAIAAAIGLQLSLPEAQDLLSRAGYTLSCSSRRDMIIEYFIVKERYAISDLNEVLESFGEKLLGR